MYDACIWALLLTASTFTLCIFLDQWLDECNEGQFKKEDCQPVSKKVGFFVLR